MLHSWQPILKWLAIIGLAPYANNNNNHRKQQLHHWQRIYTVILLAANWILTSFAIFVQQLDKVLVSKYVSVGVFVSQSVALTVCLMETMYTYRLYFEFMQQSQQIVWLFQRRLQTGLCRWSLRRRQCRKYIWFACVSYGSLLIPIIVISIKIYYGYFWYALGSVLVLRTRCLLAIVYIDYIDFYLSHLNMKLRSVLNARLSQEHLYLDVNYKMLTSFDYLLQMKVVYGEVRKLTLLFDDLFGWSLCAVLTVAVLDIIINSYWTLLALSKIYEYYFIYVTMSTVIPLIMATALLCHAGENCKQQCITAGILIQKLIHSKNKFTNAKIYNDLLFEFAMQIQHDPLVISLKEFVVVDLRLLMQIFTAIVTYLVILLQFRWTYTDDKEYMN